MRRLIVNADDFGLTEGVNRAIAQTHRRGLVSSATLMASGPAFQDAVQLTRELPDLSVGCHVILVDGLPFAAPSSIPTLAVGEPAHFQKALVKIAARASLGCLRPEEIFNEVTAQIKTIQAARVTVSHLDTHKHTHLFPAILEPLLRAAVSCGVPAIRNPIEPTFSRAASNVSLWKRRVQLQILRGLAGDVRGHILEAGLCTTDGTLGILATGSLTLELFRNILDHIPEGTWEFVCHPGYEDASLRASGTRLLASRNEELEILTSDDARRTLEAHAIQLISYRDLAPSRVST